MAAYCYDVSALLVGQSRGLRIYWDKGGHIYAKDNPLPSGGQNRKPHSPLLLAARRKRGNPAGDRRQNP